MQSEFPLCVWINAFTLGMLSAPVKFSFLSQVKTHVLFESPCINYLNVIKILWLPFPHIIDKTSTQCFIFIQILLYFFHQYLHVRHARLIIGSHLGLLFDYCLHDYMHNNFIKQVYFRMHSYCIKCKQLYYRWTWIQHHLWAWIQHYPYSKTEQQVSSILDDQWSRKGLATRNCSLCDRQITW